MHVGKSIQILLMAGALAPGGLARERSAPLDPIAGFELRLLDKKFPIQITAGGKTEEHDVPVWVFMPEAGLAQAALDEITQPADLDGGTTSLPAPPDGFGLRALKLPIRENFVLADGRYALVEIPVFVYYRRVGVRVQRPDRPPDSSTPAMSVSDQNSAAELAPAREAQDRLEELRSELARIHRQFSAIVPLLEDSAAKARFKILVQQLDELAAAQDDRNGDRSDGPLMTTSSHDPKLSL